MRNTHTVKVPLTANILQYTAIIVKYLQETFFKIYLIEIAGFSLVYSEQNLPEFHKKYVVHFVDLC